MTGLDVVLRLASATSVLLVSWRLISRLRSLPLQATGARQRRVSAGARRRQVQHTWPDAVELLLLTINAGLLPRQALAAVAPHVADPIAEAMRAVERRCVQGERFADALGELSTQVGAMAHPLVDGLAAADRYGMPLAPVLAQLADDARQRRRRSAEAAARQLPVRLAFPMVLCTLPAFVLLAIAPMLLGALSSLRR